MIDRNNIPQTQSGASMSLPQPLADTAPIPQQPVPTDNNIQPSPAQTAPQQPISQAAPQATVAVPQDTDSIEPAWVNRVNHLIQQQVGDPRLLSQEFAKLKGQYIAGRYGKEIKHANGEE